MSAVAVRRGIQEDLPQVMALVNFISEAPGWTEAMYGGYVSSAPNTLCSKALFVAEADGYLCGFAAVTLVAGQAELESIAVPEAWRRAGVGSALLVSVRVWAQKHGAASLELEVRAANERAQAFYAAHGFRAEGRRARYYKDPEDDALLMRLDLDRTFDMSSPRGGQRTEL